MMPKTNAKVRLKPVPIAIAALVSDVVSTDAANIIAKIPHKIAMIMPRIDGIQIIQPIITTTGDIRLTLVESIEFGCLQALQSI